MADDTNTAERDAFEAWAKGCGYQSDELARCKLGFVSPAYFNLNTENAWKAWQARASLAASAGSEPVAWRYVPSKVWGDKVFTDDRVRAEDARQAGCIVEPLYTLPSPPEGMAGWTKAEKQLPPCGDDRDFIGINTAGFAGVFNAVRVIDGNTYCLMETAEESVSIMSDLDVWKPFIRPPLPASEAKEL